MKEPTESQIKKLSNKWRRHIETLPKQPPSQRLQFLLTFIICQWEAIRDEPPVKTWEELQREEFEDMAYAEGFRNFTKDSTGDGYADKSLDCMLAGWWLRAAKDRPTTQLTEDDEKNLDT